MSIKDRKERQRAERYDLILATACQLAESEGWDAVTTRRLSALIDYSQPVLYSHFEGKADIMAAAAMQGFEELASRLKAAAESVTEGSRLLLGVCTAYLDFAHARPAIYEAMFSLPTKIKFANAETPAPLRAAFAELVSALGRHVQKPEATAEVLWSALHGMVVLGQSGRIPMSGSEERLDILARGLLGDDQTAAGR